MTYNIFSRRFWFGDVDTRPLAAFRIALSLLILKDALYHLPLAGILYSDAGIFPRTVMLELARPQRFSLMDSLSHPWMVVLFFLFWIAVVVGLLVGYRTRLLSIVNFLLIFSIHDRNLFILNGADTFMRVLSFWMIFIPVNGYYSLDAWLARRRGQPPPPKTSFAFPVRMIQIQVAVVYFFAGLIKVLGEQWRSGIAMFYVFQLDNWLLPPGLWFRSIAPPWLLAFITRMTIILELAFPVLVFAPILQPGLRILGLVAMAGLHLGIAVFMNIPDFSIVMLISYLTLFEPGWIIPVERLIRRLLRLSPEVEPPARVVRPTPTSTPLPAALGEPEFLADGVAPLAVESVAPSAPPRRSWSRALQATVLSVLMLMIIWWNFASQNDNGLAFPTMPEPVRNVLWYTGMWQGWAMFSPLPLQIDGWISVRGRFEDGAELELRTGGLVTDQPVRWLFGPNTRWVKYEEQINNERQDVLLREWGRYYCREYNEIQQLPAGRRLATLEIYFVSKLSHAPDAPENTFNSERLWRHWCYDEYAY